MVSGFRYVDISIKMASDIGPLKFLWLKLLTVGGK